MKRLNNIYHKIISIENLRLADINARRHKAHYRAIQAHDRHAERDLQALHEALLNHTFHTSQYTVFKVFEPKERDIYRLPYYPDRILHHAVMQVCEPIWLKILPHNTFSCIKGRGIDACAQHVEKIIYKHASSPCLYCLKIDIRKYYPSIDHGVMKSIIRRKIKDKETLHLLDEIIDSTDGLAIGNYLSQSLANLYLAYFMHYVNEVLKVDAAEYADDIVFFSDDKTTLHNVLNSVKNYIENDLKVRLKSNWQIFPIAHSRYDKRGRGLDFVGYVFFRDCRLVRKRIKKNLCRHAAKLRRKGIAPTPQNTAGWYGWLVHSDSKSLQNKIYKKS